MRVKKRVKRGVKKGIKRVKSAPPEAYLAGSGVLVGGAAVLLLATTKRGQELLKRTVQLALGPEADERESQESDVPEEDDEQESQESDVREDVHDEPADADVEEEPAVDADGDEKSKVTDLKPRDQRPRSVAPGGPPRSSRTAPAPAEANAKGSYVAKPQWLSGCLFDDNSAGMLIMAGGNGKPRSRETENRRRSSTPWWNGSGKCSAAEQEDRTTREPAGLSLSPADSRVWRHPGVCIACRG